MRQFQVTADIWSKEPGFGNVPHQFEEFIEAADWDDAKRQALAIVNAKQWHWTAWRKCGDGWEKNRTAQNFQYSWLRVDPAD